MGKKSGKRGGGRGKPKSTLRDLSRIPPQGPEGWDNFFRDIRTQSPRGAALICGSLVDSCFRVALQTKMHVGVADEEGSIFEDQDAPLASFSARIRMAWALGIIGPNMRKRATSIRLIRNAFAHSLAALDFKEPLISKEAMALPLHKIEDEPFPDSWPEAQTRYVTCCLVDAHDLVGHAIKHGGGHLEIELD